MTNSLQQVGVLLSQRASYDNPWLHAGFVPYTIFTARISNNKMLPFLSVVVNKSAFLVLLSDHVSMIPDPDCNERCTV